MRGVPSKCEVFSLNVKYVRCESRDLSCSDAGKLANYFLGERQPQELQNRNPYVKKYAATQYLIEIRKFGCDFVQNRRFRAAGPEHVMESS